MGGEIRNDDTVVVRSSIALLQERFRELQRVKVMRQQKEALRRQLALSDEPNYVPDQAARLPYHPTDHDLHVQLSHGHGSPPSPSSLSLWPTLQLQKRKREDEEEYYIHRRRRKIISVSPLLINLWPKASSSSSSSVKTCSSNKLESTSECESDDVDTSLHL